MNAKWVIVLALVVIVVLLVGPELVAWLLSGGPLSDLIRALLGVGFSGQALFAALILPVHTDNLIMRALYAAMGDKVTEIKPTVTKLPANARTDILRKVYDILNNREGEDHIYGFMLETVLDEVGKELKTDRGRYVTRLARAIKSTYGYKLTALELGKLGDIIALYTSQVESFYVDVTHDYGWKDGMFGHSGSCYWTFHVGSRDLLQEGDTLCLRRYDSKDDTQGIGRAWVVRVPNDPHAVVLFNLYGWEKGEVLSVVSKALDPLHIGMTRVSLCNRDQNNDGRNEPWINDGIGICIYDTDKAEYSSGDRINIDLEEVPNGMYAQRVVLTRCYHCECRIRNEDDIYRGPDGEDYCESCFDSLFTTCDHCGEVFEDDEINRVYSRRHNYLCDGCLHALEYVQCDHCREWEESYRMEWEGEFTPYCSSCHDLLFIPCAECGESTLRSDAIFNTEVAHYLCESCDERTTES